MAAIRKGLADSRSHYALRQLAEVIVSELRPKDYNSEILAVFHFVWAHTRYTQDPRRIELVKAPYIIAQQLLDGNTPTVDCDDLIALTAGILEALGHHVEAVTAAFKNVFHQGERQYTHIFVRVREPSTKRYIVLDPVPVRVKDMLGRIVAAKIWPL